ncbi:MAG: hypothetical protein ACQESA_01920 [Patescibacteria group bacterium]
MIIYLYGNAFEKRRRKLKKLLSDLKKKRPESEVFSVNEETFGADHMDGLLYSRGLFEEKHIIVLTGVFRDEDAKKYILKKLPDMESSGHVFFLVEDFLTHSQHKKILDNSYFSEGFQQEVLKEDTFNIFVLTDAIGERKSPIAWKIYNTAIFKGKSPEEIHGIIFWIIKSMQAAKASKTAKEAGMKPYPFSKAQKFSGNYSSKELMKISESLIEALEKERKGKTPLRFSLESVLLSL